MKNEEMGKRRRAQRAIPAKGPHEPRNLISEPSFPSLTLRFTGFSNRLRSRASPWLGHDFRADAAVGVHGGDVGPRDPVVGEASIERRDAGRPDTLRHEVAHHLGWGERGVRELGL